MIPRDEPLGASDRFSLHTRSRSTPRRFSRRRSWKTNDGQLLHAYIISLSSGPIEDPKRVFDDTSGGLPPASGGIAVDDIGPIRKRRTLGKEMDLGKRLRQNRIGPNPADRNDFGPRERALEIYGARFRTGGLARFTPSFASRSIQMLFIPPRSMHRRLGPDKSAASLNRAENDAPNGPIRNPSRLYAG
ncbi:hypothetical protein KM043_005150 [Ampulex compressa]|nr:hypothetical protein KM043_005150 [Ampulex compressa]